MNQFEAEKKKFKTQTSRSYRAEDQPKPGKRTNTGARVAVRVFSRKKKK